MATLNKNEFHELRNSIYDGLVKQGIITESDTTFIEIENFIINSEGITIDWEDEGKINSREESIKHRFDSILEDLHHIQTNINGEDLAKETSQGCELITHFSNIEIACDLDSDESLSWAVADKSDWEDNGVDGSAFLNVTAQVSTLKQGKRLDSIIQALHNFKDGDSIDGETMEYLIGQVGMTNQMLRQLVMTSKTDELTNLLEERKEIAYKGKFTYHKVGITYIVDEADPTTLEEDIFDTVDAIAELVTRENGVWRFSDEYIDELIYRYILQLEKEIENFHTDDRSGSCFIEVMGSEKVIYCTPFHEDANGVPISVDIEGDSVYNHLIEYNLPTNLRELENFKKWYRELVMSLLQQY